MAVDPKTLELITDKNGNPLPQRYNSVTGKMELEDGSVQLTGRSVEEIKVVDNLALADTSTRFVPVDASKYKKIYMLALSTLNQDVSISFYKDGTNAMYYFNGTDWVTALSNAIVIGSGHFAFNSHSSFKDLVNDQPLKQFNLRMKCAVAPTSGSITILMWGAPN